MKHILQFNIYIRILQVSPSIFILIVAHILCVKMCVNENFILNKLFNKYCYSVVTNKMCLCSKHLIARLLLEAEYFLHGCTVSLLFHLIIVILMVPMHSVMRARGINSSGCLNIFAARGHPISVRYALMPSE